MKLAFAVVGISTLVSGCFKDDAMKTTGVTQAPDGDDSLCAPLALRFNAGDPYRKENTPVPACGSGAGGEAVMRYSILEDPSWASCVFSKGLPPDYLTRPEDTLEITYCLNAPTPGQLAVYYELPTAGSPTTPTPRFPMVLAPREQVAAPGCHRQYFRAGTACPAECRASAAMAASAQFALVGEYRASAPTPGEAPLEARLVSIRKYPGRCVCLDDGECPDSTFLCSARDLATPVSLPTSRCPAGVDCAGLCRDRALDDGEGTVGRTASGIDPDVTNAFREAYRRLRPLLGAPGCPAPPVAPVECQPCNQEGGGCPTPYLFDLGGTLAQRFYQPGQPERVSAVDPGWSALVLNRRLGRAESLRWPFLQLYRCLRRGGAPDAGPTVLGLPLGDAWTDGAITRQSFELGDLSWVSDELDINTTTSPDEIDLSGCVAALGTVKARLKPRGTSDIVLFTFATGPEGLKTNPVTGKVGDVSKLSSVDWAPNEGDPSSGADQLTIGFSDLSQSANFFIEEKSGTRDLTGTTLFVRVKVTQGFSPSPSVPGGLVFLVYDQAFKNCYSKYNNVEQGGVWREYTFDLRECAPGPSAPDLTKVAAYGLQFATSAAATTAKPTEAHVLIDTFGYRAVP